MELAVFSVPEELRIVDKLSPPLPESVVGHRVSREVGEQGGHWCGVSL